MSAHFVSLHWQNVSAEHPLSTAFSFELHFWELAWELGWQSQTPMAMRMQARPAPQTLPLVQSAVCGVHACPAPTIGLQ